MQTRTTPELAFTLALEQRGRCRTYRPFLAERRRAAQLLFVVETSVPVPPDCGVTTSELTPSGGSTTDCDHSTRAPSVPG